MLDFISPLFKYFDEIFVLASAIFGYAIFFLYFYNSEHWKKLEWADRILLGIFIGGVSYVCIVGPITVIIVLYSELFYNHVLTRGELHMIWISIWILIILFLISLVSKKGFPLHEKSKIYWEHFKISRSNYIYLVFLSFLLTWLFQRINYPNLYFYKKDWEFFLFWSSCFIFWIYVSGPVMFYNLTSIPDLDLDFMIEKLILFWRQDIDRNVLFKNLKVFLFFVLLICSIINLDSTMGIVSPKITMITEEIDLYKEAIVTNMYDESYITVLEKSIMYFFKIPILNNMFNLSSSIELLNPSNLTKNEYYKTDIDDSPFFQHTLNNNKILILVKPTRRIEISIKIKYFIKLDNKQIFHYFDDKIRYISNNTEKINYTITYENLGKYDVFFKDVKIMDLYEYNQIWNYTIISSDILHMTVYESGRAIHINGHLNKYDAFTIKLIIEKNW